MREIEGESERNNPWFAVHTLIHHSLPHRLNLPVGALDAANDECDSDHNGIIDEAAHPVPSVPRPGAEADDDCLAEETPRDAKLWQFVTLISGLASDALRARQGSRAGSLLLGTLSCELSISWNSDTTKK